MSCVNGSMNRHIFFQQDWYLNNGDVSGGNGFVNRHTLSQCKKISSFKDMDGDVENVDTSGGYGSMNTHYLYQRNALISLIVYNNSNDIDMNYDLRNGDVSCGIVLLNIHTLSQCN